MKEFKRAMVEFIKHQQEHKFQESQAKFQQEQAEHQQKFQQEHAEMCLLNKQENKSLQL